MTEQENDRLGRLEIEVRNNTGQLEKIVKNDLPHITGKIKDMSVLLYIILAAILALAGSIIARGV